MDSSLSVNPYFVEKIYFTFEFFLQENCECSTQD